MSLPDTALEEEIRRLEQLRARNPRAHTFARLADLYRKSGHPAKGLEIVQEGLSHHPHYLNAHLIHGRILSELGHESEAAEAFRRVLEIDDDNLVAREALAAFEPRPDPPSWLAQLEAEWRERPEREVNQAGGEPVAPDVDGAAPDSETPQSEPDASVADDTMPERPKPDEKLLARDPYSARLAASLDEARRLSREGSRRAPSPTPAAPPLPREFPRPRADSPPARSDTPIQLTIREQLTAILEERAPLGSKRESVALRRLRRWLDQSAVAPDE